MFCCESDSDILTDEACCNGSFKLTQPIDTVIAQLQSGVGAIPVATSFSAGSISTSASDNSTSTDIPPGAIKAETTAAEMHQKQQQIEQHQQHQQYRKHPPPTPSAGGLPEMASSRYGSPIEGNPA
ncbi:hypothetical protein F4809DRAFT_644706 [Biscogniauxia mediterranea]|nr:hypothetical protein F4809DRAFT_644706 [Biscogniauxia mediterranea]